MSSIKIYEAKNETDSCDNCIAQEGSHYCLLHGKPMKNMNLVRCDFWKEKAEEKENTDE